MTSDSRKTVIARLQKLQAMATSAAAIGNADEAAAFAGKVAELLTRHKLTMSEIDVAAQDATDPVGGETFAIHRRYGGASRPVFWQIKLAQAVATAHFCDIMLLPEPNRGVYFVGRTTDRTAALYVYDVLLHAAFRLSAREYRLAVKAGRTTTTFVTTFRLAFVATIRDRYAADAAALTATERAAGRGRALIRLDTAHQDVTAFVEKISGGVERALMPPAAEFDQYAAARGKLHGAQVDIRPRGVGAGTQGAAPPSVTKGARRAISSR